MMRVLFVDDEPSILEALERMLFLTPELECAFASSGERALTELERSAFDVIVTDMRMPGMDGAALLARVLERHPTVIRIVLSGHTELEVAMRVAPVAHQFLTKPCQPERLMEVIERACAVRTLLADRRLIAVAGRVKQLPLRPKVYGELTRSLSLPRVAVGEIARIIELDVGLAAKVLQLVNSAFIGLPHRTSSIESAVQYIGFNLLKSVIAYCEVFEVLVGTGIDETPDQLHSLLTAAIARELVRDGRAAEDAFTAGLFHDVGRMVLARVLADEYAEVADACRARREPPYLAERRQFGATSAEVGAYLLALWGIPYPVVEAVANHPEPWRVSTRSLDLPAIVHIACVLSRERQSDPEAPFGWPPEEAGEYFHELGLATLLPEWRRVADEVFERHERSAA